MNNKNFTRTLNSLGIKGFPVTVTQTSEYRAKLTTHREKLYSKILQSACNKPVVYYAGCGADPLPRLVFGRKVIYGSLREAAYFDMLHGGPNNRPQAYRHIPGQIKKLNAMYADASQNPFGNNSVDVIITHYTSLATESDFLADFHRILRPGGRYIGRR